MNKNTKAIALYGVMLATLFVAMTLDSVFSSFFGVRFAIVCVASTAAFALARRRPGEAVFAGLFFGVASFATSFMFGKTTFYNPLVSVLPRLFTGITGYLLYLLAEKLFGLFIKNVKVREYISLSIGGLMVALSNTVYTLTCMHVFASGDPLLAAFTGLFAMNILPEMIVSTILTPVIVLGVRRGLKLGMDGNIIKKNEKEEN